MKMPILAWLAACALLFTTSHASAQAIYPNKPVKIVVPAPPGTGPDVMVRLYADQLSRGLGQQFIVENRVGASGNIGAEAVAKAPADGYTLFYAFNQIPTMNPHLFTKLGYDMQKDMVPISMTLKTGYVLLANIDFKANNLSEAIALARQNPDKVAFASYGPGTASHLAIELIQDQAQSKFLHVPYRQGVLNDLMGGQVSMVFEPFTSALPYASSGKLKALAVTTAKRLSTLPNVPTITEALPGFEELGGWQGVWAPAGTPPDVLVRLQAEFSRITQLPEMQKRIRDLASEPIGSSSQEMARAISTEYARWGKLIKTKNIRLD